MSNHNSEVKNFRLALGSIIVYREILKNPVIDSFSKLIDYLGSCNINVCQAVELYSSFIFRLLSISSGMQASFKEFIVEKIIYDENCFSKYCESNSPDNIPDQLMSAVSHDLNCLQLISEASSASIKSLLLEQCSAGSFEADIINSLPLWSTSTPICGGAETPNLPVELLEPFFSGIKWSSLTEHLYKFYNTNGSGEFARYKAFIWEHTNGRGLLKGVSNPDPINLSDLIGYEMERSEVISNTQQFLKGYHANNMLLYGDRGTGKSSTVKAILNEYCQQGLRLIEVPKMHLSDFHEIVRILKNRNQKFIIFVDDLVFEDNEADYTTLKAVLEGGIEAKPDNVVIYATSNRRHLIKEKFSDRAGLQSGNHDDEVRASDTLQEKLSLSDRFGITVVFSSPDKKKYLEIVEGIAQKRGLKYQKEILEREALKWELWYNGRSPRTARQFVDWLEAQGSI